MSSSPATSRFGSRSRYGAHVALISGLGLVGWVAACGGGGNGDAGQSMFQLGDGGADGKTGSGGKDSGHKDGPTLGTPDALNLGDGSTPQPTSLVLSPSTVTIVVDGSGTASASFTLQGKLPGGSLIPVLAQSVQFNRPDLATVAPAMSPTAPTIVTAPSSSAPYGGTGTLNVVFQGLTAAATVIVKVQVASYGTGLSATSPSVLALGGGGASGGADGGKHEGGAGSSADGSSTGILLPTDPAASILYPYDQTVWPLGLTSPRIMWTAPATGDVYRAHYEEANYAYDSYFTLAQLPAQAPLDQGTWDHMTASNNAAASPDPLAFTLSRYDSTAQKAYLTASETWTVAPQSLAGAIYYWSASENAAGVRVGHISRFYPGSGATPQALYNGECVGCHAVNAKGTVLVGNVDDSARTTDAGAAPTVPPFTDGFNDTRAWASFDITQTAAPLVKQTTEYGADLALTPDGKYVVFGGEAAVDYDAGINEGTPIPGTTPAGSKHLSLSDLSGNIVVTSGLDDVTLPHPDGGASPYNTMMPAFSPDGTKLAVVVAPVTHDSFQDNVLPQVPSPNPMGLTESVAYLSFDETGPTFNPTLNTLFDSNNAAFTTLGPGGVPWTGIAYPSFTPDSTAVAFHVGQYATSCNSFNVTSTDPSVSCGDFGNDNGTLFIATLAAKQPIRMAKADTPPVASEAYSAVEPTFNPNVRGGYSWVVFTSLRQFGNQPWPSEVTGGPDGGAGLINAKRRLWVAAVDTTIGTVDPSHPAIYLEGQDDTPNMRAFWTLASCIATPGAPGGNGSVDGGVTDAGKTPGDGGKDAGDAGKAVSDAGVADGGSTQCTNGFQCCSGFCENGMCVDVSTVSCVSAGGACKASADCCNPSLVECGTNAMCTAKPPM